MQRHWYYIALLAASLSSSAGSATRFVLPASTSEGRQDTVHADLPTKWKKGYVYVAKVVDGDTFWVHNGVEALKVRLIGIDAPETRNAGRKKKNPFGAASKAYLMALTLHQWVRLEFDVQLNDRYGRRLAYVYLEDGTFLNAHLVQEGYAVVSTHPPNVKYVDFFLKLQHDARHAGKGLYGFP